MEQDTLKEESPGASGEGCGVGSLARMKSDQRIEGESKTATSIASYPAL